MIQPNLIKTAALCAAIGVSVSTLGRMALERPEIMAAKFRRGLWRIDALRKAGVLAALSG